MGLFILLVSYVREQLWTAGLHLTSLRWSWTVSRMQTHIFTGVLGQKIADKQVCSSTDITRSPTLGADLVVAVEVIHPPTHTVMCLPTHICALPPTSTHSPHTDIHAITKQTRTECPDIVIMIPCRALMCELRWQFPDTPLRAAGWVLQKSFHFVTIFDSFSRHNSEVWTFTAFLTAFQHNVR